MALFDELTRAGNPDVVDNPDLLIGSNTAPVYGQGFIATPGGIDTHVHLVQPRLIPSALAAGMTTLITGGLNDNPAFNLTTCSRPRAFVNRACQGGQPCTAARAPDRVRRLRLKVHDCAVPEHRRRGAHRRRRLRRPDRDACRRHQRVVRARRDGRAIAGRSIMRITWRASAGPLADILAIGIGHVIGSSTTPTIPYGRNVVAEHHAMMWSVHGMNPRVPSDRAMIADRVRDSTMRAESLLHDLGAISIINSDSQGMGRIGEVIRRTWQLAHQMKRMRAERPLHDNPRILQYLAKYTINPARARWTGG
jgi:urease subunit alpha